MPAVDDAFDLPRVADIRRRVGREKHQIGELAGHYAAKVQVRIRE